MVRRLEIYAGAVAAALLWALVVPDIPVASAQTFPDGISGFTGFDKLTEAVAVILSNAVKIALGLGFFGLVWAGFHRMIESTEERSSGRSKMIFWASISGLVLVLLAKGISTVLTDALRYLSPL